MDININTGLQVLAGDKTKILQARCEDYLTALQEWYNISDKAMGICVALLHDYTESFAGDAYDTGIRGGAEMGRDVGYKKLLTKRKMFLPAM